MTSSDITERTPLPAKQLFVAYLCLAVEAFSMTLLFPFVPFMVRDFKITDNEEDLGYYSGFVAASFTFAQFLSSFFWGAISDRFGRRPVLLIGLLGNAVCIVLFGLSKSFWQAILYRTLNGLVNGNIGVIKTYVREVTDNTNQSKAFSFFGIVWGGSLCIGPLLGGVLTSGEENGQKSFFVIESFPYLIPCLLSSLVSCIGLLVGFLFLKESHPNPKPIFQFSRFRRRLSTDEKEQEKLLQEEQEEEKKVYNRAPFLESIKACGQRDIFITILSYVALCFQVGGFDEMFSVFSMQKVQNHGFGFTTTEIAYCLGTAGITLLIFQVWIWPIFERHFRLTSLYRFGMIMLCALIIVMPFFSELLAVSKPAFWVLLMLNWFFRGLGRVVSFTVITILQANAITEPSHAGAINGVITSAASLVRAASPIVCCSLLSFTSKNPYPYIDYHFTFIVVGIFMALCGVIPTFFLSNNIESRHDIIIDVDDSDVEDELKTATEKTPLITKA